MVYRYLCLSSRILIDTISYWADPSQVLHILHSLILYNLSARFQKHHNRVSVSMI